MIPGESAATPPRRVHYGKLPGLKDVYLEDSYVLSIADEPGSLRFTILLVLRDTHVSYVAPTSQDRYCYRLGVLEFRDASRVDWSHRSKRRYRDADGRVDYGNVDVFFREADGSYHLEGDWGVVDVSSSPPIVRLAG
jgi:hypothetical protein